jgi:hypothetical protein
MKKRLRSKLTYANVVSSLCLFLLLGGGAAFAAGKLAKNSVGSKQLKKNSVSTVKIKNGAVTEAKVANGAVTTAKIGAGAVTAEKIPDGSLTGAKVDASTLGTVPSAQAAKVASSASTAGSAEIAKSLTPTEPWHVVDASGEPEFLASWYSSGTSFGLVSFYKDQTGVVHLRGPAVGGSGFGGEEIFKLPPGFRPDPTAYVAFPVICDCSEKRLEISGSTGAVSVAGATYVYLEGISFKAEG